jgi:hypothetical protein
MAAEQKVGRRARRIEELQAKFTMATHSLDSVAIRISMLISATASQTPV